MQRAHPVLALSCRISAVLDEEPGQIHMTPEGRPMQRGCPVLALGCCIGTVFDEKLGHIYVTVLTLHAAASSHTYFGLAEASALCSMTVR